ncbi:MAG: YbaB/EbfC family nucleoid-associated protein [Candidatus Wallbacteria bacterium]|nr:YbaB/EbfC family nucleoid-associated protein [Candidatus Wallbacteria bacterium]
MSKGPFFGGGQMGNLMKEAQKMQKKMLEMQEELENKEIEGTSGGETVKVKLNGKGVLIGISIAPDAIDPEDPEMLQDLILAAYNDAHNKVEELSKDEMSKISGGLPIPGLF